MATDTSRLQGELAEEPDTQDLDVERLLMGFIRTLLEEQKERTE